MNKIELFQALKDTNGLSKIESEEIVNLFFNEMADARLDDSGISSPPFGRNICNALPRLGRWG